MRVEGLGLRVQELHFRVWDCGFRVWGLGTFHSGLLASVKVGGSVASRIQVFGAMGTQGSSPKPYNLGYKTWQLAQVSFLRCSRTPRHRTRA